MKTAFCTGIVAAGLMAVLGPMVAAESNSVAQLRVAAVQMRSSKNLSDNLARITNAIARCARDGARVVVFPECALSGYFEDAATNRTALDLAQAEKQLGEACRAAGIYALVGSPWRESDKLFNSALILAPTGQVIGRYHKIHLAERWPKAGDDLLVFKIDGVACSVIICHDERYPELVRLPVLAGAQVIFCLSHESGVRQEHKMAPYRAQIQARAVENTIYVVQANAPANEDNTGSHGQSRIVGPDGNLVQEASIFEEETLAATLDLKRATRSFAKNSQASGPLRDWWKDGVQKVRVLP